MRIIYFLSVIVLFGCNKFKHADLSNSGCELCGYAKSLEGEYRGYMYSANSNISDSISIFIEQVFIGESKVQDSLVMQLKMTYVQDNKPPIIDTLRINNNRGKTMDYSYYDNAKPREWVFNINSTEIEIDTHIKYFNSTVMWRAGTFYKQ